MNYRREIDHQKRLTEHWKAIARKYEPTRQDPKWASHHIENVITKLLDVPSVTPDKPPDGKLLKRNHHSTKKNLIKINCQTIFCHLFFQHINVVRAMNVSINQIHYHGIFD